jgi:hypothetical protein
MSHRLWKGCADEFSRKGEWNQSISRADAPDSAIVASRVVRRCAALYKGVAHAQD